MRIRLHKGKHFLNKNNHVEVAAAVSPQIRRINQLNFFRESSFAVAVFSFGTLVACSLFKMEEKTKGKIAVSGLFSCLAGLAGSIRLGSKIRQKEESMFHLLRGEFAMTPPAIAHFKEHRNGLMQEVRRQGLLRN
jgi:hypothetical protein